jgi:hypothetical protein
MTHTQWPALPDPAVFHGPAGEFVLRTDPRTESHPRTEVSNLFSRNKKAREIDRALQALIDAGRLERTTIRDPRSDRTLTIWRPPGEPAATGV